MMFHDAASPAIRYVVVTILSQYGSPSASRSGTAAAAIPSPYTASTRHAGGTSAARAGFAAPRIGTAACCTEAAPIRSRKPTTRRPPARTAPPAARSAPR